MRDTIKIERVLSVTSKAVGDACLLTPSQHTKGGAGRLKVTYLPENCHQNGIPKHLSHNLMA